MTMLSGVTGPVIPYAVNGSGVDSGLTALSPDALLAYCQTQLGSLDGEMSKQIKAQELGLAQRTAVESVQTTLEGYGTDGPQTYTALAKCSQAFDDAIAKLGAGDPVAAQLAAQKDQMNKKYGSSGSNLMGQFMPSPVNTLETPPQNDDWKGTTEQVGNLADAIKSDAEIKMLQLQDLVSERQQAVEQATGMMSKEDQTLDDGAKAIGQ